MSILYGLELVVTGFGSCPVFGFNICNFDSRTLLIQI